MASSLSSVLAELKRRKVYHVGLAYVAVAAGVVGVCDAGVPDLLWARLQVPVGVLLLVGFPIALVLAWAYEVRPEEQLASVAAPAVAGSRRSIVVLPFDNMSPDPGDAYFANGLTEEIITTLSAIRPLRVISRSSAMVLKEAKKDVRTIGRELEVGFVLEGSVRKAGEHLRIAAQLIDAQTDTHLWADTYEGVLDDVFGIQARVSTAIAEVLNLRITPRQAVQPRDQPTGDARVFDCYLRARHDLHIGSRESCERAVRTLESGLALFGDEPLLLATLGEAHFWRVDVGFEMASDSLEQARALAERALSLDPASAHAKALLANLERRGGSLTACARLAMEAHALDPNDPEILLWAASFAGWYVGQYSAGLRLYDRLFAIDPLSPLNYLMAGLLYLGLPDRRAEGLAFLRKSREMGLELPWTRLWVGYGLALNGRVDEAIHELEDALAQGLPDPTAPLTRFFLGGLREDRQQALAAMDERTREYARLDSDFPFLCAGIFAKIGEVDEALRWIRHSIARGNINHPLLSTNDPYLENLRSDARFQEMMTRLKPKWEAFEFPT